MECAQAVLAAQAREQCGTGAGTVPRRAGEDRFGGEGITLSSVLILGSIARPICKNERLQRVGINYPRLNIAGGGSWRCMKLGRFGVRRIR